MGLRILPYYWKGDIEICACQLPRRREGGSGVGLGRRHPKQPNGMVHIRYGFGFFFFSYDGGWFWQFYMKFNGGGGKKKSKIQYNGLDYKQFQKKTRLFYFQIKRKLREWKKITVICKQICNTPRQTTLLSKRIYIGLFQVIGAWILPF